MKKVLDIRVHDSSYILYDVTTNNDYDDFLQSLSSNACLYVVISKKDSIARKQYVPVLALIVGDLCTVQSTIDKSNTFAIVEEHISSWLDKIAVMRSLQYLNEGLS